jgi:hypothetical protein
MATQQRQPTDGTTIEGYDAIAAAIQLYIDGAVRGSAVKLTEAFPPNRTNEELGHRARTQRPPGVSPACRRARSLVPLSSRPRARTRRFRR